MFGTDFISNGPFFVGSGGITVTARLKVDAVKKGTVFAFFLYGPPTNLWNTIHDEIDFEFVGNYPGYFNTNIYGAESLGVGHPQYVQYPGISSMTDYHTYQIKWLPTAVSWYIDGVLVRSVTNQSPLPKGPMYIHFNAWVPDSATWTFAYDPSLIATSYVTKNEMWSMSIDSVKVESDPQRLTTIEVDPTTDILGVGATEKLEASAIDQNQNTITTPMTLTWASDNPSVAKVSTIGVVTAVASGTAKITASVGPIKSTPTVITVPPVSVVIKTVPVLGTNGKATGVVNGLNLVGGYSKNRIAVYINVYGGWWTKPSYASPTVAISSGGAWSANITTGGSDAQAGEIRAYLVPTGISVPTCSGDSSIPSSMDSYPFDSVLRVSATGQSASPVLRNMVVAPTVLSLKAGGGITTTIRRAIRHEEQTCFGRNILGVE